MKRIAFVLLICGSLLLTNTNVSNIDSYASSTRTKLEATLKQKQNKLKQTRTQVSKLEKEIETLDNKIEAQTRKLQKSKERLKEQQIYFNKFLVRVYKKYDVDLLAQLFSSTSLGQFLNRLQIVGLILKEQSSILSKYLDAKTDMETALAEIKTAQNRQKPLLAKASKEISVMEKELKTIYRQLEKLNAREGIIRYYDGKYGTGVFCSPCPGGRLVNNFMQRRPGHYHKGIDILRSIGSPICAADDGVVTKMKSNPGGYGYYIVISHGRGLTTLYGHMYRSTVTVRLGQRVRKGQMIARVGMNGRTTGPHLHFEVMRNGNYMNPMRFLV